MKKFLNLLWVIASLAPLAQLHAEDDDFSERARVRAYPGGKDEERIQVQTVLPEPEKKYTDKAIQNQVIKRPTSAD